MKDIDEELLDVHHNDGTTAYVDDGGRQALNHNAYTLGSSRNQRNRAPAHSRAD